MSYSNGTFNVTSTKLKKWHLSANHNNKEGCIYCAGDMEQIAEEFYKHDIEILSVGHAWIKIKAVKNYTPYGGGRTDEIKLIYNLISGQDPNQYSHRYEEQPVVKGHYNELNKI
ncbi:hypothetical protein [Neobacillus vireti]|uniref:Uncharacterized protein n=1 Tax=Neobacillus vireti LMG 21834 TaxID=1131730 RepID=A0AB94IQ03_9BACI|nr:hypothetical protein [Neobacillus vireti]ETI69053.1 hypothetical protein BAVI_09836 [Neobacillus vireti LMG 21834]KLT15668.1 hypothetical protein AA980_20715 [Neobacillus vireti]